MIIGKWWRKRDRARERKTVREREREKVLGGRGGWPEGCAC